jgi:hypothetical protein
MRAKVVISASVLALAILLPVVYFHFKSDSPPPVDQAPAPVAADDTATPAGGSPSILKRIAHGGPQEGLPDRPVSHADPGMDHDAYVLQRRAELMELGMHNDPDSLKTILSELENPDAEIRQGALSATIDFGSKDAIPTLQNEMNWATDPEEKVAIKKAIDFLDLTPLDTSDNVTQQ